MQVRDVLICDSILRDGLQSVSTVLGTEQKQALYRLLVSSGVTNLEVTSMVPPKLMPQFADATQMIQLCNEYQGVLNNVLAPNAKGVDRAIAAGAQAVVMPISVSETHSQKNLRKTVAQQLEQIAQAKTNISQLSPEQRPYLAAGISTAFGCSYEGKVSLKDTLALVEHCLAIGVDEIGLGDTVGYATPKQVASVFTELLPIIPNHVAVRAHFHDTFGFGLANVASAYECGVKLFDASLSGLGGCPFAPNASGNITLQDCVLFFQMQGVSTGIDLDRLRGGDELVKQLLPQSTINGSLYRCGHYPTGFSPEQVHANN